MIQSLRKFFDTQTLRDTTGFMFFYALAAGILYHDRFLIFMGIYSFFVCFHIQRKWDIQEWAYGGYLDEVEARQDWEEAQVRYQTFGSSTQNRITVPNGTKGDPA